MTQVKEMTNSELNRALAELMGYSIYHYDKDVPERCYYMLMDPELEPCVTDPFAQAKITEAYAWEDGPDYCTDPAASLEVQTAACKAHFYWYIQALSKLVKADGYWDDGALDHEGIALLLTATPRERAEAAYITLSQVSV